jgi:K+-sensing histidine kinase KdpD
MKGREQAYIRERFYRVIGNEVQSESDVELGVGLHLCQMVIEQPGGVVGVQGRPGKGPSSGPYFPWPSKKYKDNQEQIEIDQSCDFFTVFIS